MANPQLPSPLEVRDDRGRVVSLFAPTMSDPFQALPPGFDRAEFRRIRRRIVGPDTAYRIVAE
jgi:hypothetical protein